MICPRLILAPNHRRFAPYTNQYISPALGSGHPHSPSSSRWPPFWTLPSRSSACELVFGLQIVLSWITNRAAPQQNAAAAATNSNKQPTANNNNNNNNNKQQQQLTNEELKKDHQQQTTTNQQTRIAHPPTPTHPQKDTHRPPPTHTHTHTHKQTHTQGV